MTIPNVGHPDWRDVNARRGAPVFDQNFNLAASGTQRFGLFSVIGYASVELRITTNSGSGRLDMWSSDSGTFLSGHMIHSWILRVSTDMYVRVAVPRDWVEFDITAGTGAGWVGHIDMIPIDVGPDKQYFQAHQGGVGGSAQVLASGLTVTMQPLFLVAGPAMFFAANTGAPNAVVYGLSTYDEQSISNGLIAQWNGIPAIGVVQAIELPETGWRLQVTNNTAGNITWWSSITPRGGNL